jgi:hypothetical protein
VRLERPQPREEYKFLFPGHLRREVLVSCSVDSSQNSRLNAGALHVGGEFDCHASVGVSGPKLRQFRKLGSPGTVLYRGLHNVESLPNLPTKAVDSSRKIDLNWYVGIDESRTGQHRNSVLQIPVDNLLHSVVTSSDQSILASSLI